MTDPNNNEQVNLDANANQDNTQTQVTETETTVNQDQEADQGIDYKVKFSESSREAQRLLQEKKDLEARLAELEQGTQQSQEETYVSTGQTMEDLYPGFSQLEPDAQANLIAYTDTVKKSVTGEIYKDPAIAFARKSYNESVWDKAFDSVASTYPELVNSKSEFKQKYFNVNNVPQNVESILKDIAKIYLFDKSRDMGAQDERNRQDRIETERANGGNKDQPIGRTLQDWERMAQEDPSKFARMSREYAADLASGKLKG